MNIQEKISWLERELEEIKKEVEKQDENNGVWKPWEGEDFCYLDEDGEVHEDYMGAYHESKYRIGNMFKSEEDAEFMVERLRVIAELKQFSRPFEYGGLNYVISWDCRNNSMWSAEFGTSQFDTLYFESEETIKQAIKEVGEERVKKYYLQVKED